MSLPGRAATALARYDVRVPDLEALQQVLAAFEMTAHDANAPAQPSRNEPLFLVQIKKAVGGLPPEKRKEFERVVRQLEEKLNEVVSSTNTIAGEVMRATALLNDNVASGLVEESLKPSRVGDLTPTREALRALFAQGTKKAIADSRAAGLPVSAAVDGRVVEVPPSKS